MPSWNIHTAHVEKLLAARGADKLGIGDANAFLFGNYVPDIYLGFMVPDTTFRLDYCMTHHADVNVIPLPDADDFWDRYLCWPWRKPSTDAGLSLAVGAWAHLVADRFYNGRFRVFRQTHDTPDGEELRKRKQADFDLFGHSLGISMRVAETPQLLEAARAFRPYSVLPADVARTVRVADGIVRGSSEPPTVDRYQLLDAEWMSSVFEACHERLLAWLGAWRQLDAEGALCTAAAVRARAGLFTDGGPMELL